MIFVLLDDGAGPPVGDDERQRIFMFGTNVNEMNVQPIDFGDEVRQGAFSLFDLAPIVICRPIAGQCLRRRELHALRLIRDRFPVGPPCRADAFAQFSKFRFRNIHTQRTNPTLLGGQFREDRGRWGCCCWGC